MTRRIGLEVSLACSEAVKLANVDVIAAYPITPQTHIVEHLAELVADGYLDAEFISVESEHSAISACIGSSAVGARTFTSSSAQGLALMHEILFIASAFRLPIVMAVANRSLSAPLSIWNDHSDIMSECDIGWIQVFAENGQEVFDLSIYAFKVAEDPRVNLPFILNMDGFLLTHVIEPIEIPDQTKIDSYLPSFSPQQRLDVFKPISIGLVGIPEIYTEAKKACLVALENSYSIIIEHWEEFAKEFGRKYRPIETYKTDEAKTIIVTMGSIGETCMSAIDEMLLVGERVGQLRIRLWRPFPKEDFIKAVKGVENIIVIDRALSPGGTSPPVASELKSLLYDYGKNIYVSSFIVGLGGRDVTRQDFKNIIAKGISDFKAGKPMISQMWGVRE